MPPKKAEPEPVEEIHEPEKPNLSPEETLAKAMGVVLKKIDKNVEALMDRSTSLTDDPKMKEISAAQRAHAAATQSKPSLEVKRRSETLRTGGCGSVDRRAHDIEHGVPAPLVKPRTSLEQLGSELEVMSSPSSPVSSTAPAAREPHRIPVEDEDAIQEAALRRLAKFSTDSAKGRYTDYADKAMKRLMLDMDLARDPERQRHYSHQTRCDHLDKSYGWYKNFAIKEQKNKIAPSPPYLKFSTEGPVAAGSMRVQFRQTSPLLSAHRLGHSASSPSLLSSSHSLNLTPTA